MSPRRHVTVCLLLLGKDLRVLRRSPSLLAVLVAYPLVLAALVGLAATFASAKPRVALVDRDGLPDAVELAGERFDVAAAIDRAAGEVELVRLGEGEARRRLEAGAVVAVVTVPRGFVDELRGMASSPALELETARGGLAPGVRRQVQALVYQLNRSLQDVYVEANLEYVRLLLEGGEARFGPLEADVLGLRETERLLAQLPPDERVERIREFVRVAELALAQTGAALRATAAPIELREAPERGRSWALSAQAQASALALTLSILALVLAAGALAAERDEHVVARLVRGLVGLGQLVAAKVALAAVVALVVGLALALAFGLAVELGGVEGGQAWSRLPLLAPALLLAGAALGALGALLGALARDARSASLVALLVVVPLVLLGLLPEAVSPLAARVSDALPFAHATRLFEAVLYEPSPWGAAAREAAWLAGLGLVLALLARRAAPRLLA